MLTSFVESSEPTEANLYGRPARGVARFYVFYNARPDYSCLEIRESRRAVAESNETRSSDALNEPHVLLRVTGDGWDTNRDQFGRCRG
jgi:hypothetical protein